MGNKGNKSWGSVIKHRDARCQILVQVQIDIGHLVVTGISSEIAVALLKLQLLLQLLFFLN